MQLGAIINLTFFIVVKSLEAESEQFTERHQLPLAPFEYQRSGTEPGLVLIFNQEAFDDKSYRRGSRRDVNEIINCVSRLGFNINDKCIFTDYTRDEILETVKASKFRYSRNVDISVSF